MVPTQVRGGVRVVLALIAVAALTAPGATAGERTLRARLDETFAVHDHVYPKGGVVTVRTVRSFLSEDNVHEVSVNGTRLGILVSRESARHGVSPADSLVFERSGGLLTLVGISWRDEPYRELYRFERSDDGGRWTEAQVLPSAIVAPPIAR